MAWLDDNPPARSQFRYPRREQPSGVVVVHTAENTPDFVAFDGGAEAVAKFIQNRDTPGSYHDLGDSDSCINLVRYDAEAFHDGTGSNPHSYGVSVATRADVWPIAPEEWRDGAVQQAAAAAARYAKWLHGQRGITIPARRITRDESELRIPGFISHAERDPERRKDPGVHFPWDDFLAHYAHLMEDDDMPYTPEELEKIVRDAVQKELATPGDPSRSALLDLMRRGVAAGHAFLAVAEGFQQGGIVYYTNYLVKVGFPQGSPLHTQIKADLAVNGISTNARALAVEVLDAIPDAG